MNAVRYKDLILETIDQLRKRKARPDIVRICHMLERRHGLKADDVQAQIQTLVDAEVVIKVDYKGSTSYRNAAKWVGRPHPPALDSVNVTGLSDALRKVGKPLLSSQEPRIAKSVVSKTLTSTRETPDIATKEVICGRERRQTSVLVSASAATQTDAIKSPVDDETEKFFSDYEDDEPPKTQSPKKAKTLGKRKRFKKSHGPDFVDTESIASSDSPEFEELHCDYCLMTAAANRNGEPEELLLCKDCSAKAHPSCMDYSPELAARSRLAAWQCLDCKTCFLCKGSGDGDCMLVCDACDKGYHMTCHKPKVSSKPIGKWMCNKCNQENRNSNPRLSNGNECARRRRENKSLETNGLPTPCDSPTSDYDGSMDSDVQCRVSGITFQSSVQHYPDKVPDAKDWTIGDVVRFFCYVGFHEQAPAFREQEIDGKSLLLMKRSDVLTGLSIRLGPALKIYNHIKRLQTGLPDGHLIN